MEDADTENRDNIVFIGRKETMSYVLAAVTQLNSGSPDVILKARGKAISKAVDVAEIVRNKFIPDAVVESVDIDTEEVTGEDGRNFRVSSIAIYLKKE